MTYLPILTYHRILATKTGASADPKRIAVHVKQFRRHLAWLSWLGYSTIRLEDYAQELKRGGRRAGCKTFAITFDDAYEEVLTLGLPILKEYGFIAATFAVSAEQSNRWDDGKSRLMTSEQLKTWKRAGMEVGAHSCHHAHLTQIDPAQAKREIVESKQQLQDQIGGEVSLFAYPYGETNDEVDAMVSEAGYDAAFATDRAPRDHRANRFRLRRAVIFPRNNAWQILWKAQKWYPRYQDFKR
jgi:peptidoglycan/xylan/chitin deacetylase (PgdA/CDA1 family)